MSDTPTSDSVENPIDRLSSHSMFERMLPLGLPRFNLSLLNFVKFIGYEMVLSATQPEEEKQPAEAQAQSEPVNEGQPEKEAGTAEEPNEEQVQPSESHLEEHGENKQEASG